MEFTLYKAFVGSLTVLNTKKHENLCRRLIRAKSMPSRKLYLS